jgi:hypothetical protein
MWWMKQLSMELADAVLALKNSLYLYIYLLVWYFSVTLTNAWDDHPIRDHNYKLWLIVSEVSVHGQQDTLLLGLCTSWQKCVMKQSCSLYGREVKTQWKNISGIPLSPSREHPKDLKAPARHHLLKGLSPPNSTKLGTKPLMNGPFGNIQDPNYSCWLVLICIGNFWEPLLFIQPSSNPPFHVWSELPFHVWSNPPFHVSHRAQNYNLPLFKFSFRAEKAGS